MKCRLNPGKLYNAIYGYFGVGKLVRDIGVELSILHLRLWFGTLNSSLNTLLRVFPAGGGNGGLPVDWVVSVIRWDYPAQ
jgi:hypothetical protein